MNLKDKLFLATSALIKSGHIKDRLANAYEYFLTDIESDPALFESYKERIPVVRINGEESFVYKAHEITLRKKLDKIMEL